MIARVMLRSNAVGMMRRKLTRDSPRLYYTPSTLQPRHLVFVANSNRLCCCQKSSFRRNQNDESLDDEAIMDYDVTVPREFPPNLDHLGYKDHRVIVDSARLLKVLRHAFHMSASDVKNFFFAANLRLNHVRVGKRSQKVKKGDVIDLVLEVTESEVKVKRLEILDFNENDDNRIEIWVRKWKFLKLPRKV